jgi:hypothetical protein
VPAEISEVIDATTPSATGWKVYYKVKREDGLEVFVDASCTDTAEMIAREAEDPETVQYLADRGRSAAIKYAESAHGHLGKIQITLLVDSEGLLRHMHDYERRS